MKLTSEQIEDIKWAAGQAFEGIASDLGECDPEDAIESVVFTIESQSSLLEDATLRRAVSNFDPDVMDVIRDRISSYF